MSVHRLLPAIVIITTLLIGCGAPAVSAPTSMTIPQSTAIPATAIPPTVPIPTAAPLPSTVPTEAIVSQVDTFIHRLEKVSHFSGSILIARDGTVIMSKGYGFADRDKQIPNTPQTKFRIASITKQFTAMAILQLQQQGKLNVQDLICKYIPDCPAAWKQITIHQLLTHTSGIPDLTENIAPPTTPSQIVTQISSKPLDFKPGEKWSYSNAGYIVLSAIIEQVSGTRYEQFLRDHILTPLKLQDTGLDPGQAILATGYQNDSSKGDNANASALAGAGGLYSTVEDLYRWDQALYTEQLISKDLLDKMFTAYASLPDDPVVGKVDYGYGWFILRLFNHRDVGHGGLGPGISANIDRFPDDKVTIIFLCNQENLDINTIGITLARIVFGAK